MNKTFRPWDIDQVWLLPPSVHDFVASDHPAHLIREIVREELDLGAILSTYEEPRGFPPFHPGMMTALLLYAYAQGIYSSRRIARACEERVDVMAVTGLARPDFRTINQFRKRHLAALADLFVQVLALCRRAGMVRLGHVALDGSKVKANASKHKAMSYGRMVKAEAELAAEVAGWLRAAEAQDSAEDAEHGPERRGDEPPDWMRDKQRRLERIRTARAEMEAEAKVAADAKAATPKRYRGGRKPKHPPGQPKPQAQRNFTDPDSCIMVGKDGYIQAYNAQIAVDAEAQVIVAHRLARTPSDQAAVVPLVDAVKATTGARPKEVSADAGFCSEANLAALAERRIKTYVATGRAKDPAGGEAQRRGPLVAAMRDQLRRAGRRSRYRLRKQVVEPVFGQIKQARGFRQFLLRGCEKVAHEWALICTAHNLAKLCRA
ncbi:MAG TPA: IS1182 family transposase [Reyranella sp.]|jgi:transposase|nr:IS1182 family transposase [Reyranella sp.]